MQPMIVVLAGISLFMAAKAFVHAPCWAAFVLAVLVAGPIWHYQTEYGLFRRQAILARLTRPDSGVRRWLWPGNIFRAVQVLGALAWAALLLALTTLLAPEEWIVLAADLAFVTLGLPFVRRRLRRDIDDAQLGMATRQWPLLALNIGVLTLAFLSVNFFVVGAPDTRELAWSVVAERAFSQASAGAACAWTGWMVGFFAAAGQLAWHASEVLIPSLPDQKLRLAAWAAFLVPAGLLSLAFTRFLFGVFGLIDRLSPAASGSVGIRQLSGAFFLPVLFLAVPYLYLTHRLDAVDPAPLFNAGRRIVAQANPCRADTVSLKRLESELAASLDRAVIDEKRRSSEQIDQAVNALFADVEPGVDRYLDWYFSIVGEYTRLGAWAMEGVAARIESELERHLVRDTKLASRIEEASRRLGAESADQMKSVAGRVESEFQQAVKAHPCWLDNLRIRSVRDLEQDRFRISTAIGAGVAVGAVAAAVLARKAASEIASRAAAQRSVRTAASIATRVAARRGGSIALTAAGAAAICAPGGPLAALCAIGAGAVAWLIVDKAFIAIDEARFRSEMRAEILEAINQKKNELAAEMKSRQHAAIDSMASQVRGAIGKPFVPFRDGL